MTTTSHNPSHEILYRSEDAQQILNIAIARQAEAGELTRTQLLEVAAELNIDPVDILAAEQEWASRQSELTQRQTFDRLRQGQFRSRLIKSGIMGGFFYALGVYVGSFFFFPIWGIGFGVALAAWKTYGLGEDAYNAAFLRWRQRQQLKRSVTGLLNRVLGLE
jgi:hypothetical protein